MSGPHTAFFYGTLMEPKVFFTVVQGNGNPPQAIKDLYTFTPAVLTGYTRHRVQFADYPGMIPEEGGSVLGIYATGLTDANVSKLDFFEGSEYEKKMVKVKVQGGGSGKQEAEEEREATAYIYKRPERLDRREWSFDEFRRDKMHVWTRESYVFEGCNDSAEFEKIEHEDAQGHDDKDDAVKQNGA
ncbi:AIG2-like family protein [Colletotrichum eremochloae]|nr:AIG2-like family protein [Colletotrichum eremochloae]